MHLLYLTSGEREYGHRPTTVHRRNRWAFQFCLQGRCEVHIEENGVLQKRRLEGSWMTIMGPECAHGWTGKPDDRCDVAVFQFDEADYQLRTVVGLGGYRCVKIGPEEIATVRTLYHRCESGKREAHFSLLIYRIVATELALMALRKLPAPELGPPPDFEKAKVAAALAWYETNLPSGPTIGEVAEALHLSAPHLRRLFHRVRGISPQAVFTQVQFERATELLANPELTLEAVAIGSGFGGGSAFSRAFRKAFGVPPKDYRSRLKRVF